MKERAYSCRRARSGGYVSVSVVRLESESVRQMRGVQCTLWQEGGTKTVRASGIMEGFECQCVTVVIGTCSTSKLSRPSSYVVS